MSAALQGSDEWLASRQGRITGSRVGAILGDNPYQSRDDVLRQMVREHFCAEREFRGNEATRYGTQHEPDARAAYETETGSLVEEVGLIVHPKYDWLAASPDGLIDNDGCVEFKAPFRSKKRTPPKHYWHQMQLVMHCTDRDYCDYFVWWADATYLERVQRDDSWLRRYLPTLAQFMADYEETIASDDAASPHLDPLVTERLDAEWREYAREYIQAKEAADIAAQRLTDAKENLLSLTQCAAEGEGVKVTPYERAGSIDWSTFAKERGFAEEAEAYRKKVSKSWRVTI